MPDSYPTKYWTLEQTLAWIAHRDPDRVNTAYKEWRDFYYEPRRSGWLIKDPLIWDWRSRPVDELDRAAHALRQKCQAGALHGTGREGVGVDRSEIALLRWPDLMLVDIAGTTAGPQFYDSSVDLLAIENRRVGPTFHDVLFTVAYALKAFPTSAGQSPATTDDPEPPTPTQREVKQALLDLYPNGIRAQDTIDRMLDQLSSERKVIVGRATLVRTLRYMPTGWRRKR